jgi:NAD(P)-dependent dehydrogenase (short-subunit alcohol dehydrogenase family)
MISKYQMTRMPDGQFGCAPELTSFGSALNVAVLGASGGIGGALADMLERSSSVARVYRIARCRADQENRISITFDLADEDTIAQAAGTIKQAVGRLHLVIVATGLLHRAEELQPEKTWRSLNCPSSYKLGQSPA